MSFASIQSMPPGCRPRREVGREEAVAVQPPRRHQDEDPERRVAEREALRAAARRTCPGIRSTAVDVAVVDLARICAGPLRVVGRARRRSAARRQVQEPAELVVARHAELAAAQDVGRGQVHGRRRRADRSSAGSFGKLCRQTRPGFMRAERVEEVRHRGCCPAPRRAPGRRARANVAGSRIVRRRVDRAEVEVVGDQRMHPVDGDELLGQRVRHAVVVPSDAGDAAEHLAAD